MATEIISDHVEQALNRTVQQFRDKEKIEDLLSAIAGPSQALEDALWQLFTERDVDTAVGVQLQAIGSLVGQPYEGQDDDDYRRLVRARISVNKSMGAVRDIVIVARLVVDDEDADLVVQRSGTAAVVVEVDGVAVSDDLATNLNSFLQATKAAGVRLIVEYSTVAPAAMFFWDSTDWDDGFIWSTAVD